VKYTERKEFLYDPDIFLRSDTATALKIYDEFVRKHSPIPRPRFFEVRRDPAVIDKLWHGPSTDRIEFSREIDLYAINQFQKPDWRLTKIGIVPQRKDNFITSNLLLKEINYFPTRGDFVYWQGYRYLIVNAVPPPEAYWQQTGVWLGINVECVVAPEGDARPLKDLSHAAPIEMPSNARSER